MSTAQDKANAMSLTVLFAASADDWHNYSGALQSAFDDAGLNAEPDSDHQDRGQAAPEGRIPSVIARQRMKFADAAAGRFESLAAPHIKSRGGQKKYASD